LATLVRKEAGELLPEVRQEVREMTEATTKRTPVKTRRVAQGQYASLNGQVLASWNEDGKGWTLAKRDGDSWTTLKADYRTSDLALTAAVIEHGFSLEALNIPPAKPKPEAKVEREESERRSGTTGPAPKAPTKGRPHMSRGAKKVA
jgi:hypothetical protein